MIRNLLLEHGPIAIDAPYLGLGAFVLDMRTELVKICELLGRAGQRTLWQALYCHTLVKVLVPIFVTNEGVTLTAELERVEYGREGAVELGLECVMLAANAALFSALFFNA